MANLFQVWEGGEVNCERVIGRSVEANNRSYCMSKRDSKIMGTDTKESCTTRGVTGTEGK